MLMRTDPFRAVDQLAQQLLRGGIGGSWGPTAMPIDAYRAGDRFVVHVDLPGVDPEAIELNVERKVLSVKAERTWTAGEETERVISERPQGVFSRQLYLGEALDTEHIDAHYDAGVLTLTIPVAETARPRKIAVGAGRTDHGSPADDNRALAE